MNLLQKITSLDCEIMDLDIKKRNLEDQYAKENTKYKVGDIVKVKTYARGCVKNVRITSIRFDSTRLMYYHGVVLKANGKPAKRYSINIADSNHYYNDIIIGFIKHSTIPKPKRTIKHENLLCTSN